MFPRQPVSGMTAGKPGGGSAERLANVLAISHDDAARTLSVTTQLNRQNADSSLSQNFGTTDRRQRYKRLSCTVFTDTVYVTNKARSNRGNVCAQVFVTDKSFLETYPMRDTKSYFHALKLFTKEVGVPDVLVC